MYRAEGSQGRVGYRGGYREEGKVLRRCSPWSPAVIADEHHANLAEASIPSLLTPLFSTPPSSPSSPSLFLFPSYFLPVDNELLK